MMESIPSWAVKGAKVVYVDGSEMPSIVTNPPIVGEIYTIVRAKISFGIAYIHIDELRFSSGKATRWMASRFRPAISQSTDIAKFRHLLNPTREDLQDLMDEDLERLSAMLSQDAGKGRLP